MKIEYGRKKNGRMIGANDSLKKWWNILFPAVYEAGEAILFYYGKKFFPTLTKEDGSPVTAADRCSHEILTTFLEKNTSFPVLSEEDIIPFSERKNWDTFWLIDPLDGTRDFLNKTREFSICVTLIQDRRAVLGLIYAPFFKQWYFAKENEGSYFVQGNHWKRLLCRPNPNYLIESRLHRVSSLDKWIKKVKIQKTIRVGSALKFCIVASGNARYYLRLCGSKEWDLAAGHIIVEESGGTVIDLVTKVAPTYNKKSLENSYFMAAGLEFENTLTYLHEKFFTGSY